MDGPLTPAEALVGIGMCAAYADGSMDAAEDDEFQDAISSFHALRALDEVELRAAIMKVDEISRRDGDDALIERAADSLPADLRPTAYYLAVDLARADGELVPEERAFLGRLQRMLGVDDRRAREILDVVALFYRD